MPGRDPKFHLGEVVNHIKFDYRGVIVGVDPTFKETEDWYEQVAKSRPPKDQPWYRVLVDEADHLTYVAERHLDLEMVNRPVRHPLLHIYFDEFREGRYILTRALN